MTNSTLIIFPQLNYKTTRKNFWWPVEVLDLVDDVAGGVKEDGFAFTVRINSVRKQSG